MLNHVVPGMKILRSYQRLKNPEPREGSIKKFSHIVSIFGASAKLTLPKSGLFTSPPSSKSRNSTTSSESSTSIPTPKSTVVREVGNRQVKVILVPQDILTLIIQVYMMMMLALTKIELTMTSMVMPYLS
ncbi:hypothetical protein DFJ63DRAFT_312499 [Scheffersomyces coipomensis]|uniref:uncharacterized protein n=1 Tax=Scheffersomyces coipomensis TaxID=1788519 RepID=UPI00315C720D